MGVRIPLVGGAARVGPGGRLHADVAQRLAHHHAKVRVASSNLVICSHAVVARQVEHDIPSVGVAGSKPVSRSHALVVELR
jgi:hypothetical protein